MTREDLRSLLGKPVLVVGDRTDKKKPAQNLELLTSVLFAHPKLQFAVMESHEYAQVAHVSIKSDHAWVPVDCKMSNGYLGFVCEYERKDGTKSFGLRNHESEAERKHLMMRLIAHNFCIVVEIMSKNGGRCNLACWQESRKILEMTYKLFNSCDQDKWGELAFYAIDEDFRKAFGLLIRDLQAIDRYWLKVKSKQKKVTRSRSKGFAHKS